MGGLAPYRLLADALAYTHRACCTGSFSRSPRFQCARRRTGLHFGDPFASLRSGGNACPKHLQRQPCRRTERCNGWTAASPFCRTPLTAKPRLRSRRSQTPQQQQQPYQNPLDKPLPRADQPAANSGAPATWRPHRWWHRCPRPQRGPCPDLIKQDHLGSAYISDDDTIAYPYGAPPILAWATSIPIFIGMRPWTRRSLLHALELSRSGHPGGVETRRLMGIYVKPDGLPRIRNTRLPKAPSAAR